MNDKYSMTLMWSTEDEAYIARVPELPGCFADGGTVEEAVEALHVVIEDWLDEARRIGQQIPAPLTTRNVHEMSLRAGEQLEANIQKLLGLLAQQLGLGSALTSDNAAAFWERDIKLQTPAANLRASAGATAPKGTARPNSYSPPAKSRKISSRRLPSKS